MADQLFMIIAARPRSGVFSIYMHTLQYLDMAEKENRIPIVHWETKQFSNADKLYNGIKSCNLWDYYFEPVSEYSVDSLKLKNRFAYPNKALNALEGSNIKVGFKYIQDYPPKNCWRTSAYPPKQCLMYPASNFRHYVNKIIEKYVKLREPVIEKIDDFYNRHMAGKKVLGVHIRTAEGMPEILENHGKDWFKDYFKYIDLYLDKNADASIFLAIEHIKYLSILKERYGKRLLYQDHIKRWENKVINKGGTSWEVVQFGDVKIIEEVIIDAYLLSRCDFMLRNFSNISSAASFINSKMPIFFVRKFNRKEIEQGLDRLIL